MSQSALQLSIGLPVFNGENYLEETLNSILAQTFSDFELIISDNASSDGTQDLCERYAKGDSRIRYYRQPKNLGASENYNFVFNAAGGEYFKWAAHDDLYAPCFLERCVEVLEKRPDVVLVFTRAREIDETGEVTRAYPSRKKIDEMTSLQRFCSMVVGYQPFIPVFGVIRREVLACTKLIGKYSGSDRPLIGELALRGNIYEVPEYLFFYRVHPMQSWGGGISRRAQQVWYDPTRLDERTYPTWRLFLEHERTIWRVPMSLKRRFQLHWVMIRWIRTRWRLLLEDISG